MKRKLLIEFIWLIGSFICSILISQFLLGNSARDINMHDTYAEGRPLNMTEVFFWYFIIFSFCIYFVRSLYHQFKTTLVNIILLTLTALLLYFLGNVLFIFSPLVIERTSSALVKGLFYGGNYSSGWALAYQLFRIFLILLFSFTAFMIGRNWEKKIDR
jgi:hypothetical protein